MLTFFPCSTARFILVSGISIIPSENTKAKGREYNSNPLQKIRAAEEKKRSEGRRKNLIQPNAVVDNAGI